LSIEKFIYELNRNDTLYKPTVECWNWCSNAQLVHNNNVLVENAFAILGIVSFCLLITYIILTHINFFEDKEKMLRYAANIILFALILVIGYFISFNYLI